MFSLNKDTIRMIYEQIHTARESSIDLSLCESEGENCVPEAMKYKRDRERLTQMGYRLVDEIIDGILL